jgi:ribonuclease E
MRMSLIETSSESCPYCEGTGVRRSTDSAALVVLRAVQEEANDKDANSLIVHVPTAVALYILNQKRQALADIEKSTEVSIILTADESLIPPAVRIERVNADGQIELVKQNSSNNNIAPAEDRTPKRRRRPRRRVSSGVELEAPDSQSPENNTQSQEINEAVSNNDEPSEDKSPKRRRRGKRGGRRRRGRPEEGHSSEENPTQSMTEGKTTEASEGGVQETPFEHAADAEVSRKNRWQNRRYSGQETGPSPSQPRKKTRCGRNGCRC